MSITKLQSYIQKRNSQKLTQWQLAAKLAMPLSYVGKYEQGERRLDIVEIMDIAEALNFDPVELVIELKKIDNKE